MPDVFSQRKRSEVMSRIRGRGNKDTEIALMTLLRRHHVTGWRRNQTLFGKPDFVFRKEWVAVFVDGCFWHGCPRHATKPKSNRLYWRNKFHRNKQRDRRVNRHLREIGWHVVRIWECVLVRSGEACIRRIQSALVESQTTDFQGYGDRSWKKQ